MRLFVLILALAWPAGRASAAACGTVGMLINGFDGAASACTGTSEVTGPVLSTQHAMTAITPSTFANENSNVQGDMDGRMAFTANSTQLTVTAGNFAAGVPTNWNIDDGFLMFSYASTSNLGSQYTGEFHIFNGATPYYFTAVGTNVTRTTYTTANDWTPLILSLNYARNLGWTMSNIASVSIRQRAAGTFPVTFGYDNLTLVNSGNVANSPVTVVASVASCSAYGVSFPASTTDGTDPIRGYHIYKSTLGATGPYVSFAYVAQSANPSFNEIGPFVNNVYYKILPYSITTTAFAGGALGFYTRGGNSAMDPVNSSSGGGVHEALLSTAPALGPFNQASACTPTNTQTPTNTNTASPTATQTPTFSDTQTQTQTSTVTPTSTHTPTASATPSPPSTSTPSVSGTTTETPLGTLTNTMTPSFTLVSTSTITPTVTMTSTITPSFTQSPVVTPTINPNAGAQLFPNPFHPDRGETFHLGNVPAGLDVKIYNIIGEYVIGFTTKGNPTADRWDSLNANGVKVVTGIYFLLIDGKVYRVAVVRD